MTYSEKLKDPRWQKKRLEILSRDNFTCTLCGDTETTLHIHHKEYNGQPWEADSDCLETHCEHCHEIVELFKHLDYFIMAILKSSLEPSGFHFTIVCYKEIENECEVAIGKMSEGKLSIHCIYDKNSFEESIFFYSKFLAEEIKTGSSRDLPCTSKDEK